MPQPLPEQIEFMIKKGNWNPTLNGKPARFLGFGTTPFATITNGEDSISMPWFEADQFLKFNKEQFPMLNDLSLAKIKEWLFCMIPKMPSGYIQLDGKPAKIVAQKEKFATVCQQNSALAVEFSWKAAYRIFCRDGKFTT